MKINSRDDHNFLAWLTLVLLAASLWIFKSYLHYIIVAAVLSLATSHIHTAILRSLQRGGPASLLSKNRQLIVACLLTFFFLLLIFTPLIYFISISIDQVSTLNFDLIKQTVDEMVVQTTNFLDKIPLLHEPLVKAKAMLTAFVEGPAMESAFNAAKDLTLGTGALVSQVMWILIFYFLFNLYGLKILNFIAELTPMSREHKEYIYSECCGTVGVVFYGTLFNMVVQGFAFGILMIFVGDYNATYLGVLAGFCSVIPIVGAALVYVPVVALELLGGNFVNAIIILLFAWVVMGFFIDNILRLIFIGFLKKIFGFEYRMNEILILMAILAGIGTFGFWGLIIGPSVLALTFAAANLYSTGLKDSSSPSDKG